MPIFVVVVLCLLFFGMGLALGLWAGVQRERTAWLAQRAAWRFYHCNRTGLSPDDVAAQFEGERRAMEQLSIDPLAVKPIVRETGHLPPYGGVTRTGPLTEVEELGFPESVPAHGGRP